VTNQDLRTAEDELDRLAAHLEAVVPDAGYQTAALALGHRARSLFLGFRQLIESPTPIAAWSLMRPMVEINFLLRFFGQSPELHAKLWIAEGLRQEVAFLDEYAKSRFLVERWGPPPAGQIKLLEELRAQVQAVREEALAAGANFVKTGALVPSADALRRMLNDPAVEEAYTIAYRRLGADIHAGMQAFEKGVFTPRSGGLISYSEPQEPESFTAERTLVVTMFASTLCILSAVFDLGIHDRADAVKQRFMLSGEAPIAQRIRDAPLDQEDLDRG
jgi:hypothetical protein